MKNIQGEFKNKFQHFMMIINKDQTTKLLCYCCLTTESGVKAGFGHYTSNNLLQPLCKGQNII